MKKTALDEAAKKYWSLLFADYGEALTRDIPRRIKAALAAKRKIASVDDKAVVLPIAHIKDAGLVVMEGIYDEAGTKLMFQAKLDKSGNVTDVRFFDIK
jgi:hypothetical protein